MLRRGGCEGKGRDESITSQHVGGWVWEGAELERRGGGRLLVGGRGKVPIETSRAIPIHGGTSRADFAKVSPLQGGTGEVHPLGTGGAL